MTGNAAPSNQPHPKPFPPASTYYTLLGLHPAATPLEIRRAYRELSKRYHPDTTHLPHDIATAQFHQLNEAYATLSNPTRRLAYNQKIRYSHLHGIQPPPGLNYPAAVSKTAASAYRDPTDRPLSPGELFALLMMGLSLIGCLVLAIVIASIRG